MILEISCYLYFPYGNWPPCWIFKSIKFYMLTRSGGSRHITMPNFLETGLSKTEILRIVDFSRWWQSAILDLFGAYLDHSQWVLGGLYHSAIFGYDRWVVFITGPDLRGAQRARAPGLPPTGGLPPNPSYFFSFVICGCVTACDKRLRYYWLLITVFI